MFEKIKDYCYTKECTNDKFALSYMDFNLQLDEGHSNELRKRLRKIKIKKTLGLPISIEEKEESMFNSPYMNMISPQFITINLHMTREIIIDDNTEEILICEIINKMKNVSLSYKYTNNITILDISKFIRPDNLLESEHTESISRKIISRIVSMGSLIAVESRIGQASNILMGNKVYYYISHHLNNGSLANMKVEVDTTGIIDENEVLVYRIENDATNDVGKAISFFYRIEGDKLKYLLHTGIKSNLYVKNIKLLNL